MFDQAVSISFSFFWFWSLLSFRW